RASTVRMHLAYTAGEATTHPQIYTIFSRQTNRHSGASRSYELTIYATHEYLGHYRNVRLLSSCFQPFWSKPPMPGGLRAHICYPESFKEKYHASRLSREASATNNELHKKLEVYT
ncbi:MAG: hypothetical protein L6R35_004546, partial [Caloplaca aegaea]